MAKLSVIGLDGVNWKILGHAVEKGLMPNLQELRSDAAEASLETTYPPVTGPAWVSIMTGVNPGKHGVFDFVDHIESGRPYSSADIETETVYEKIARRGEVAVVNLPMSYPPRFQGDFVGSFLAPEDDYVYPESLSQRFDFSDYRKNISSLEKSLDVVESSIRLARQKKELLDATLADQDFFFLLFSAPDWIMHNHYHRMESGGAEDAFEVFRTIDEAIGIAAERSENVILLSDHGFQSFNRVFHVNEWLYREGFLRKKGSMESDWSDSRVLNSFIGLLTCTKSTRKLSRAVYRAVEPWAPLPENVKVRLASTFSEGIDVQGSQAFCPSSGIRGIYINDERFEGLVEDRDRVVEDIIERLPEGVKPLKREEVFSGPEIRGAPDIIFQETNARISRGMYGEVFSDRQVNHHGRKGFFLASGENFGGGLDDISIYDVTPTVAELFGIDMADTDGEALPIVEEQLLLGPEDLPRDF